MENTPEDNGIVEISKEDNVQNQPEIKRGILKRVVFILVSILLLGTIGFFCYYYGNKDVASLRSQLKDLTTTADDNKSATDTGASSISYMYGSVVADPSDSNLNIYSNSNFNISFKYPINWYVGSDMRYDLDNGPVISTITIKDPGNSTGPDLTYIHGFSQFGGTCDSTSMKITAVSKLDKSATNSKNQIFLIEDQNNIGLITAVTSGEAVPEPKVDDEIGCLYYPYMTIPDVSVKKFGYRLDSFATHSWGWSVGESTLSTYTLDGYRAILKSFKYIK